MSAGADAVPNDAIVHASLGLLAPRMRLAVENALARCEGLSIQAVVYESYRTEKLQQVYYARGRTVKPPERPVTNAATSLHSWHGFGLAVDVIHRTKRWDMPDAWFSAVAAIFAKHGMSWGGNWRTKDLPHFQWSTCPASPTDEHRRLFREGGLAAVWANVKAL